MAKTKLCFECEGNGTELYGYTICDECRSNLGLFTDATIRKHIALYESTKTNSYEEEIRARLIFIDKEYAKKKIKLLYILDRLQHIKKAGSV